MCVSLTVAFNVIFVDNISSLSGTDFTDSESDETETDKAANLIRLTSGLYGKQHQQRFDQKMYKSWNVCCRYMSISIYHTDVPDFLLWSCNPKDY